MFPILNRSQNWFAEMMLKQLGRQFGHGGSWTEGLAVERRFLIDSVRVDSTEFSLVDGSGLASGNLVSPLAFTRILRFIRAHPRAQTFLAGLPQAGQRGLAAEPVRRDPARRPGAREGRQHRRRVNSLSGFIERPDGRVLTFSVQANHHTQASRAVIAADRQRGGGDGGGKIVAERLGRTGSQAEARNMNGASHPERKRRIGSGMRLASEAHSHHRADPSLSFRMTANYLSDSPTV